MEIKGHITKVIYYREDNGYIVALFDVDEGLYSEEVVITGNIGQIDMDKKYIFEGDYVEHPKYGIQFKFEAYRKYIPTNSSDLVKYLSGPQFKGIGKKFAESLVEQLGTDLINKIKEDSSILDTVEKMNAKRKEAILNGLAQEEDDEYSFLYSHGLTAKNVIRLKQTYGDDLMALLIENPYKAIKDIDGIGFKTMDKFALSIGFSVNDINRLIAYSEEVLMNMCMRNGDSFVTIDDYRKQLEKEKIDDIDNIITSLQMDKRIAIEEDRVYHITQYLAEGYISSFFNYFPFEQLRPIPSYTVETNLSDVQEKLGIVYQEKQLEAIMSFFCNDVLILTGGPGTGKTTIVRGMIELCKSIYPQYSVNLIAPTGRAAKRLAELTGCESKTIHSLLLWDKETGKFARNEENPINVDILIIDEFSMVDQYLFYNLLKACHSCKKMVIIGDVDQLPSVAMGAVLRDLIDSNRFTTIKLDKIYRQKEGSDIISLAYDIKNNSLQDIPTDNDIRFFECDPVNIQDLTLQVVEYALSNYSTIQQGFMNVQVLAPKHMGLNGINNMNVALQKRFNPKDSRKKEITVGYKTFREYDKILQLKNQPDDDVFNGDIGVITEIIYASEDINNQNRIIADFDGKMVEYTSENIGNITHGYCISVHKAQGSEYPIVIMPLDYDYGIMLQKRLIYTAVTRAYKSLIFIGEKKAFYRGIRTTDHYLRNTTLKERLLEDEYEEQSQEISL